jgi:hypothetical protein
VSAPTTTYLIQRQSWLARPPRVQAFARPKVPRAAPGPAPSRPKATSTPSNTFVTPYQLKAAETAGRTATQTLTCALEWRRYE